MSAIDRYEIHAEIASGGMARVHLGRLRGDEGFQRVVAIKRMHPKLARDPKFVAMFRDEALLASRIRHANVVPTLDVVSDGGDVFIVMEYVRGLPLSTLLQRAGRENEQVPVPITVAILGGVLSGLHAAHEARGADGQPLSIVHRDVSPQNILVDTDGVARVMDFGIAKASSQLHVTMEGEIKGKLSFMAPEQVLARSIDRRADVFAAGVVAYSSLIGRPLFARGEVDEIRKRILEMKIPLVSEERPEVGAALSDVLAKALERDKDARFPTARDFAIAIEAAFDRPASARQVGAWVERLGADVIEERDREIARIEAGDTIEDRRSEGPLEITSTDAPTVELSAPSSAPAPAHVVKAGEVLEPKSAPSPIVTRAEVERTSASVVSDVTKPAGRPRVLTILAAAAALALAAAVALWIGMDRSKTVDAKVAATAVTSAPAAAASPTSPKQVSAEPMVTVAPTSPSAVEPAVSSSVTASATATSGVPTRRPSGYFPARP